MLWMLAQRLDAQRLHVAQSAAALLQHHACFRRTPHQTNAFVILILLSPLAVHSNGWGMRSSYSVGHSCLCVLLVCGMLADHNCLLRTTAAGIYRLSLGLCVL